MITIVFFSIYLSSWILSQSTVAVSPKFHSLKRSTSAPFPNRRSEILEAKSNKEDHNAPLPSNKKKNVPLKLTEPQEFKLSTDSRGEYYQRQLKRQIEQEEKRNEAARTVHATPIPKSSRSGHYYFIVERTNFSLLMLLLFTHVTYGMDIMIMLLMMIITMMMMMLLMMMMMMFMLLMMMMMFILLIMMCYRLPTSA